MKKIAHILTVLASSLAVWSCIEAPVWDDEGPTRSDEVRINLNLHLRLISLEIIEIARAVQEVIDFLDRPVR